MGLIKQIENEQGIMTGYHNINVYKNTVDGYLEITLNSYISAEARKNGKMPVSRANMLVPAEYWRGENAAEKLETAGYTYLLTLDKFAGAENDEITGG